MLMLEARDICGAATGRNGQSSLAVFSHRSEEVTADERATQEDNLDHMRIRVTQPGPVDSGQTEPMHSSNMKWHIYQPSENC
jgi:hypothetical protein